jgi:T-complex protein 1 subunit gamma
VRRAVGQAMEVIPRTLAQNCGANIIRTLTKLRAKHAEEPGCSYGINGETGEIVDMKALGIWEPYAVKVLQGGGAGCAAVGCTISALAPLVT